MASMTQAVLPRELNSAIIKIQWRQRVVGFVTGAVPFLALGLVLLSAVKVVVHAEWIEPELGDNLNLALYLAMAGISIGWLIPTISKGAAAALLDRSAGGGTVIPAAVSFSQTETKGLFAELTLDQAIAQMGQVNAAKAVPLGVTRELFYLPLFVLMLITVDKVAPRPDYGFDLFGPIQSGGLLLDIKPHIATDDPQFAVIKDEIKDLMRKTKLFGTKETKQLVQDLEKLISDVEKGKITPFEAAKKAEAIRKKLEEGVKDPYMKERETAFREIASQLKNDRDFKELAAELKKNNMDGVQRELVKLQKKMSKMSDKKQEALNKKLEKAVERAAKNLEKKASQLEKKAKAAEKKGKKRQAGDLKKQSRKMKNAAETARKFIKNDAEKRRYLQKRMEAAKKNNMKKMAKALQKALKKMDQEQKNKKAGKGNKGNKGNKKGDKGDQKGAMKGPSKANKPGNKGANKGDKKGGKKGAMANMRKALDRYARKRRESSNTNKAKMTAEEIKEAMKRLKKGGGGQCKNKGSGGIKDFFKRARGDNPGGKSGKPGGKSGKPGSKGAGSKPGGYKPGGAGNKPGGKSGGNGSGKSAGKGKGKGGKGKGKGGKGWGTGKGGKLFGKETRVAAKAKDNQLKTKRRSAGPSRFDVILGAAEKGFSKTSYKKVYNKYRDQAKEVIKDEKIPPGYKHLVKVYYRLIRPRN